MVGQRRSEPGRHGARRGAFGRGLALLASLMLVLAACGGSEPLGVEADRPGGGFGRGINSSGDSASSLVGIWRTVVVVEVPGDIQNWTTTWQFAADGTCRQTVVTESVANGFPVTTDRVCTWTTNDGLVTVSFVGGGTLTFAFSLPATDRLVLDGFEYQRQA